MLNILKHEGSEEAKGGSHMYFQSSLKKHSIRQLYSSFPNPQLTK